jgi:hypothetical protein
LHHFAPFFGNAPFAPMVKKLKNKKKYKSMHHWCISTSKEGLILTIDNQ